jgi:hypothetical protein
VTAIRNRGVGFVDDHLTENIYAIGLPRIPEFSPSFLHSKMRGHVVSYVVRDLPGSSEAISRSARKTPARRTPASATLRRGPDPQSR